MGKLIDTAVSHFNNKEIRSLKVPEWETTIYCKNLSLKDKADWYNRADGDNTDYLGYALIFGCTDEKGKHLFDVGDKHSLKNKVDPEVLSKVANFVLSVTTDEEEREKNL